MSTTFLSRRNVTDLAEKPNPADSGGTSFDGTGYVKIHNPKDFGKTFNFGLYFKTQSVNGLIFFGGKGVSFESTVIERICHTTPWTRGNYG